MRDVENGCALLLELFYRSNLSYPRDLRYTVEFLQKVLMDFDVNRPSSKVQVFKKQMI